jgi:hypothetical protein
VAPACAEASVGRSSHDIIAVRRGGLPQKNKQLHLKLKIEDPRSKLQGIFDRKDF